MQVYGRCRTGCPSVNSVSCEYPLAWLQIANKTACYSSRLCFWPFLRQDFYRTNAGVFSTISHFRIRLPHAQAVPTASLRPRPSHSRGRKLLLGPHTRSFFQKAESSEWTTFELNLTVRTTAYFAWNCDTKRLNFIQSTQACCYWVGKKHIPQFCSLLEALLGFSFYRLLPFFGAPDGF